MNSFLVNVSSLYLGSHMRCPKFSKHDPFCKMRPLSIIPGKMVMTMPIRSPAAIQSVSVSASGREKSFSRTAFSRSVHAFFDQKSFTNSWCEIAVKLIVGSFFFLGSVNVRPVVALPTQPTVNVDEGRDNIDDKIDGEDSRKSNVKDQETAKINIEDGGAAEDENAVDEEDTDVDEDDADSNNDDEDITKVGIEDEGLYLNLLEQNPRNVTALKVVIQSKTRKGELKEVVKYVERLIEVEPHEVEWRLLEAYVYEVMGQLSKAKRLFNKILRERPLFHSALHGLAMTMTKNHEGPAAFKMLNKAAELAAKEKRVTEERNIRILIAQMHLVQGELDESLRKFQALLSQDPRDFRPYLCQAIIYGLQDKEKEADEQLKIYQSLLPEDFPEREYLDDVVLAAKTESRRPKEKV